LEEIEDRYGKRSVKAGSRLLLEREAGHLVSNKAKCPFIPQREMEVKMDRIPEPMLDLIYADESKSLEEILPDTPLGLPRTWGRSTSRSGKFA
jgi:hypothetical protein